MKLIKGLNIPPSCRTIWVNQESRDKWEKPMQNLVSEIHTLEIDSVLADHRHCVTITINPEDIISYQSRYPKLHFMAIRITKKFEGFSHRHEDPKKGDPFYIHYVVSKNSVSCERFKEAYDKGDHDMQGKLLGFPECCRDFFSDIWPKGYVDPIAQMENNGKAHPYSNPLLRYIGIRVGFHIPHSFNCEKTITLSTERLSLLKNDKSLKLLNALLSMPMIWDCWHGFAVIKTPIFWIITGSNPTADRHIVKVPGEFIPKEGRWKQ